MNRFSATMAAVLLGGAAVAGCAGGEDQASPTTQVVTETNTMPASPVPTHTATVTEQAPPDTPAPAPAPTADAGEGLVELKDADPMKLQPDQRYLVLGDPSTICVYGDGFGTNIWAGNDRTSCEFVSAVGEELTKDLNATNDNIRDHLKETITATSAVTGVKYTMTCVKEDPYVACRGGEGAAVYFM